MQRIRGVLLAVLACSSAAVAAQTATPEVFAPGVISGPASEDSAAFSPDGNTLVFDRSTGHRGRDFQDQPRVERFGDDVVFAEFEIVGIISQVDRFRYRFFGHFGNRTYGSQFHFLINSSSPYIKRPPENIGKTQHVIYLVRVICTAGSH